MIEVKQVTTDLLKDAESLFESDQATAGCFCMWFIIPVVDYHAGGAKRNRELLRELTNSSPHPIGLLAYQDGEPVGWCAAGPRDRYERALRIPSFKGRDSSEDQSVWLVPCFFIAQVARRRGVAKALLEGAVALAQEAGAKAIEGFPFVTGAKLGKDPMVGAEAIFEACGFEATRRPSNTRVVMRRELNA
jgi:GNAT superfamily N-acetyltransferase